MIELKNLSVKYGDFVAVDNIDVTIKDGEFFTFLGPSGCGKTTTLRSISGFEMPSGGQILVDGDDISKLLPEERNIGFVFQNYALFPSMSVFDNIAFGLKVKKMSRDFIKSKVEDIAQKVGISEHLTKKISELSGGQQQKIAVARALVVEPKILLMDEPLSNLDAKLRVSMREEIKRLQSELKITTIYVTHDQEEALAISDRIAVFNKGTVEQIDTPQAVYDTPASAFVAEFIGTINHLEGMAEESCKKSMGIDRAAQVYIRPQKILVSSMKAKNSEETITIRGQIKSFEFLGAYSKVSVRDDGQGEITSFLFSNVNRFQVGDMVYASFEKKDVLVFGGGL